jgi:hypothetical protein
MPLRRIRMGLIEIPQPAKIPSEFTIINKEWFPLPGTKKHWWHICSIRWKTREFMFFIHKDTGKQYIEEFVNFAGTDDLIKINDDALFDALEYFIKENNILPGIMD